jgi:SAM-dependent methyltransferase
MPTPINAVSVASSPLAELAGGRQAAHPLPDLSVVIPVTDAGNVDALLPQLRAALARLGVRFEILLLAPDIASIERVAAAHQARAIVVPAAYGLALRRGFAEAAGEYVLTMDPDLSHPPDVIEQLWSQRTQADLTIASRYVSGGRADMSAIRYACSRALNAVFSRGLDIPIRDLSSGFRLYRAQILREQRITSRDYDILQQVVVQAYAEGWAVREVPFAYRPRRRARLERRGVQVGLSWLRTFGELWLLRNSIMAADYDDRAHDSRIPLQRYWQRSRHSFVNELVAGEGPVLDIGCGSSRIIADLPRGSVAVDILQRKLRYAKRFERALVRASGFALPFRDASFSCVLCSQVIEHVPKESPILDELCRVLAPGGRLVLGTPDYANWQWVYIEKLYGLVPGGYKDEHISHYTNSELIRLMGERGLRFEEERYILKGELIQAYRKPA